MSGKNIELKSKVGSPAVEKNEFFGRDKELKLLIQKVARGDSVYISAPRRTGKTSLMRCAGKVLKDRGNICFFHDLEGLDSPSDWICEIAVNMHKHTGFKECLEALIKNLILSGESTLQDKLKSVIKSEKWDTHGKNFFKALYDSCPDGKRIVIFLDELAVMIENMQKEQDKELRRTEPHKEVVRFITWLRSINQEFHKKISFVVASSIGLPPLLERLKLSANINHFVDFQLEAWEHETAKECILALARGKKIRLSHETAELMTEILGIDRYSPYYVQVFFDSANDHLFSNERDSYSNDELSGIYQKYLIRGNAIKSTLNHMVERLEKSLSAEEYDLAKRILKVLAQNSGVTSKSEFKNIRDEADEESFRYVFDILKHDGYIEESDGGYCFRDKPLRDWWRNVYGD